MMFRNEKFVAFCLLGGALVGLCVMVYLKPPSPVALENGASLAILNTIVGALVLAFGNAGNGLFKINSAERAEIGAAAASAIQEGPPLETKVTNTSSDPVQTSEAVAPSSDAGLPEGLK